MIDHLKIYCLRVFYIIFILLFIYLTCSSIFVSSELFYSMSSLLLFIGTILGLGILYGIFKMIDLITDKQKKVIIFSCFIVLFILQIFFSYQLVVNPTWDFGVIFNTSYQISKDIKEAFTNNSWYYPYYPNNLGITLLLAIPYKILSFFTNDINKFICLGIIINIVIIQLSMMGCIWLINRKRGIKLATLTTIFMVFITPLYTYACIFYTDTYSIIFPIFSFVFLELYESKKELNNYRYFILIGIWFALGVIVKTNVIITLVALIIYLFIKYDLKGFLKKIFLIIASFTIITFTYNQVVERVIPFSKKELGLPATHWIMMGLTGNGGYNEEDVIFSKSIYDSLGKRATSKANINVINERLDEMGLVGYIEFSNVKIINTWNDGTYYAPEKLRRSPLKESSLYSYVVGERNAFYVYFAQVIHSIMLFGITISAIVNRRDKINNLSYAHIAIFGTVLFLAIWETRSRYLVLMIPVFLMCSSMGYQKILISIDDRMRRIGYEKYRVKKSR